MSGNNNPLKIARSESLRIYPALSDLDIVISIGTGAPKDSAISEKTSYRHVLLDGGIPRVWRAYMANSFDGERIFWEVVNTVSKDVRDNYIRLNVLLPEEGIGIDDTTGLKELEDCVESSLQLSRQAEQAMYALLVATFYFELDSSPSKSGPGLHCSGTIRCRLPGQTIVLLLERLNPRRMAFVLGKKILGDYNGKQDLCHSCDRYRKHIQFYVGDLEQTIIVYLASPDRPPRRISAFPQTIRWFVDQQGLDSSFGTVYHRDVGTHSCRSCYKQSPVSNLKRKFSDSETGTKRKRGRLE